jgi:hypothetical protein
MTWKANTGMKTLVAGHRGRPPHRVRFARHRLRLDFASRTFSTHTLAAGAVSCRAPIVLRTTLVRRPMTQVADIARPFTATAGVLSLCVRALA